MAALASIYDVEAIYGRVFSREEDLRAAVLLNAASALVRARVPSVDDRLADGTLDAALVAIVVASVVMRVMRNPMGIKQESETAGSVSVSTTYDTAETGLYLTDQEIAQLAARTATGVRSTQIKAGFGW